MAKSAEIDFDSSYSPNGHNPSLRRNQEVLARQKVLERATEAGRKNEPRSNDRELDETQLALIDESQGYIEAATRTARSEIASRADLIRSASPAPLNTTLEQASITREAAEATSRYGSDLDIAFRRRSQAVSELRGFEEDNRLAPFSAVYGHDVWLFVSMLIAFILGEGVFNAFLFQELQDRGLIGGLMLAVGVGLANVLLGFGTGFIGWRLMLHVRPQSRLLGILTTVILMSAALALHLALGDLREAISHQADARIDFLVILKPWRWFNYTGIAPFVLVAIGVATFLFTALKSRGGSHGICSVYWGHDTLDRRFREADAVLEDAKENLKDALHNAHDGERAKLRERHAAEREKIVEIRRLRAEAQRIARMLSDSIADEIGRLHLWLRKYRDRNRTVRSTRAPAYFEQYPSFEEWRVARLDTSELDELTAEAERVLAENEAKVAALEETALQEQVATLDAMLEIEAGSESRARSRLARDRDGYLPHDDPRPAA